MRPRLRLGPGVPAPGICEISRQNAKPERRLRGGATLPQRGDSQASPNPVWSAHSDTGNRLSCDPVPAGLSVGLRPARKPRPGGGMAPIDAPMNGGSNDDLLRFLLVAAFLLATIALLIVVALLVRQP
jgi:hypothetical protein